MKLMDNPAVANIVKSTIAFAILIALWQVVGQLTHAPEHIVPLPSKIGEVFVRTFTSQLHHLGATGFATVCGLALALVVGVLLAIAVIYFASIKGAVLTVLAAFNSIPKIAVAPLFVIWFGLGIESKILLAFLLAIFPCSSIRSLDWARSRRTCSIFRRSPVATSGAYSPRCGSCTPSPTSPIR